MYELQSELNTMPPVESTTGIITSIKFANTTAGIPIIGYHYTDVKVTVGNATATIYVNGGDGETYYSTTDIHVNQTALDMILLINRSLHNDYFPTGISIGLNTSLIGLRATLYYFRTEPLDVIPNMAFANLTLYPVSDGL